MKRPECDRIPVIPYGNFAFFEPEAQSPIFKRCVKDVDLAAKRVAQTVARYMRRIGTYAFWLNGK